MYILYANYLARRFVKRLLNMELDNRREYLLSRGFAMVEYSRIGNEDVRVYCHKSGLKVTDRHSKTTVHKDL